MKFGPVPTKDAAGSILAHSVRAGGHTLKKGRSLSLDDLQILEDAGLLTVTVATLEPGDVHEDVAAQAIAQALSGVHVAPAEPFTGRANLYAQEDGLALIDQERLRAINRLDERLTVATLHAFEATNAQQMVATVKIIPFAVPKPIVDAALEIATAEAPIVSVAPFTTERVDLIITKVAQTKTSMIEKTEAVVRERLERCGATLGQVLVCPHTEEEVSAAIKALASSGVPLLLFGASAIVDRNDVIPAGLAAAGGKVEHLGMPVDPGNLLMLGARDTTPVIGVPSCARSPKLNGFDWVLQRVLAGLQVNGEDIMDMGAGGLLKEIPSRPRPRERTRAEEPSSRASPRIAAVVLAAGRSTRMGPENKLLKLVDGAPLVARTVKQVSGADVDQIFVVTGHEHGRVEACLEAFTVELVHNPDYRDGLSSSLKAGVAALPGSYEGVLVALGDMPHIGPQVMNKLIAAFNPEENRAICVPTYKGKRGNPVLWGRDYFDAIAGLSGDIGAKHLLAEYADAVCEVEVNDASVLMDLDTPEAFAALESV